MKINSKVINKITDGLLRKLEKLLYFLTPSFAADRLNLFVKVINSDLCKCFEVVVYPKKKTVEARYASLQDKTSQIKIINEAEMPQMGVCSIKHAVCIEGKEYVFTSDCDAIAEFNSQFQHPWNGRLKLRLKKKRFVPGRTVHLMLSHRLADNYFHCLTDVAARIYLFEKSGVDADHYLVAHEKSFQKQFLSLLGIPDSKILAVPSGEVLHCQELIVPSMINNWEYENFRGYKHFQRQWIPAWIGELHTRIPAPAVLPDTILKRVYISRKSAPYRRVLNETQLEEMLRNSGFSIIEPEKYSMSEQIAIFRNADTVIGIHGAGLANIFFCPKHARIVEIFSEYYHDKSFVILSNALGLDYHFWVGSTPDKSMPPQQENITIDVAAFKVALDKKGLL